MQPDSSSLDALDHVLSVMARAEGVDFRDQQRDQVARALVGRMQTLTLSSTATGEEAWSRAAVLAKSLPDNRPFNVLATDVDPEALAVARNPYRRSSIAFSSRRSQLPMRSPSIDVVDADRLPTTHK